MKKLLTLFCSMLLLVSCSESRKDTYQMPNYFKHHEKGDVKQIIVESYDVTNGVLQSLDNTILIWGEPTNSTLTYDKNGNILSDNSITYQYDENGKLISITNGSVSEVVYNELNEISKCGEFTYSYGSNNQINKVIEDIPPHGYFPASHRVYEYFDDGQLKLFNSNNGQSIYGSEYNSNGELTRHVTMGGGGRVTEYYPTITQKDDKGNWVERRITTTDNRQYLQKRTIRYY